MPAILYSLRCADGLYYVGTTRGSIELRAAQHNEGTFDGFTALRRPVTLVFQQERQRITDAIALEMRFFLFDPEERPSSRAGSEA